MEVERRLGMGNSSTFVCPPIFSISPLSLTSRTDPQGVHNLHDPLPNRHILARRLPSGHGQALGWVPWPDLRGARGDPVRTTDLHNVEAQACWGAEHSYDVYPNAGGDFDGD